MRERGGGRERRGREEMMGEGEGEEGSEGGKEKVKK